MTSSDDRGRDSGGPLDAVLRAARALATVFRPRDMIPHLLSDLVDATSASSVQL